MVGIGLLIAGLASAPWIVLTLVGIAYLSTIPLSLRSYAKLRREAERMQAEADQTSDSSKKNDAKIDVAEIRPLRKS